MTGGDARVDSVRAFRAGHEYHEAWTVSLALQLLQLLRPDDDLVAIAVEGLSPVDQARASARAMEIADLTLYYGDGPSFEEASRVRVVQFKYSVADSDTDFRASHAKKTIEKFAVTYREGLEKYGASAVEEKLGFQLMTNRPIYAPLLRAVEAIAQGLPRTGEIAEQARQFKAHAQMHGAALAAFAAKFELSGRSGSLQGKKTEVSTLLADWSAASGQDLVVRARLGDLRELVRDKAGEKGAPQNCITRTDILAVLGVHDSDDMLPCKSALSDVGRVVERQQLTDAVTLISSLTIPLVIHGCGGIGKTVFMSSLAAKLAERDEVLFFDCFGGGAYRAIDEARHLPQSGLIHIANTLSFRGLCEPMLPGSSDARSLMRTFKRRLIQTIATISRTEPGREVILFIDAVDNAAIVAQERGDDCFPVQLLESLNDKPIPGLKVIVSCRTENKPSTYARYQEFELQPFTRLETKAFLRARLRTVSETEINVAQSRSGGNPRVLAHLAAGERGLLDQSEIEKKVELDELIQQRIDNAVDTAIKRGCTQGDINRFLAGLAVLPPPIPLDECASALGTDESAVKSFVSDLFPWLERFDQGIMFKDEPTETLIRQEYASSQELLRRVADNLFARQDESVYAARALPELLYRLDDGKRLFNLAFDGRIPAAITSAVGRRSIRYARLRAATLHAAEKRNADGLVKLLVELSTVAVSDQRGATYILEHPDLVVAARDADAMRRLFETRTGWPGARHARLTIANAVTGEFEEASRNASAAREWINHYRSQPDHARQRNDHGPERPDIAAIPLLLISESRAKNAANFLRGWQDWYAYEVCECVFEYSRLAQTIGTQSPRRLSRFVGELEGIGPLAAALSFSEIGRPRRKDLVEKLAGLCRKRTQLRISDSFAHNARYTLQDGLRKAAAMALALGLDAQALAIATRAPHQRPRVSSYRDVFYHSDVFPFLFHTALVAAVKEQPLHEKDVLPAELVPVCSAIRKSQAGSQFRAKAKARLLKSPQKQRAVEGQEPRALSYEERQQAEHYLDHRLGPLLAMARALSAILAASSGVVDRAFLDLLGVWKDARKSHDSYRSEKASRFFEMLGLDAALFALWARGEIRPASVECLLSTMQDQDVGVQYLIRLVSILARRPHLHGLAGELALKARQHVDTEQDVDSRASLFASLGRAMLPASIDEAATYFRMGLEQMDAIGAGDYRFVHEVLSFASAIKGGELEDRDVLTLESICELNMGEEAEKFTWGVYGQAMSKCSGLRGLATLSRWDDRSRIALRSTLLPYLTALVEDGKLAPEDALSLNHLAAPAEYWDSGTREFARAIRGKAGPDPEVVSELIQQYEKNNPTAPWDETLQALAALAEEAFGASSDTVGHLTAASERYGSTRHTLNEYGNYSGESAYREQMRERADNERQQDRANAEKIGDDADPTDKASLSRAISALNGLQYAYDFRADFFSSIRTRVPFAEHARYIHNLCDLEHLSLHWKLAELAECKQGWGRSSAALGPALRSEAIPLIGLHADDLLGETLAGSQIAEISNLTGTPSYELVLELIRVAARRRRSVAGAVWLALGSFVCPRANDGQARVALRRLLGSDAAKLAERGASERCSGGPYPTGDVPTVAAGLVWRALGSPCAETRWHAAHSVRCFARFGRWEVVDSLVRHLNCKDAGPFQAPELAFYYLHARLWLLISLARTALDHPEAIARYKDDLTSLVMEEQWPHVLMRHFAARALQSCINAGELTLPEPEERQVRTIDLTPHPHLKESGTERTDSYHSRPDSIPRPAFELHFDYEFHKLDVDSLGRVFGKSCWEVADTISSIVHRLDPAVSSMYDAGGRDSPQRYGYYGFGTEHHGYGQQLGWHALFIAAGEFLRALPVVDSPWYNEDAWEEWLGRYLLTREDGLWLSDGTDTQPLDTASTLLEKGTKSLKITGARKRLLQLAGIGDAVGKELVVEGRWFSADDIGIHISSALVPPSKARVLARALTREEPVIVWIPVLDESESDLGYRQQEYAPWIVCPSGVARLDEHDPYGATVANLRPRLAREILSLYSLRSRDPFERVWSDKRDAAMLRADAWGRDETDARRSPHPGLRLICASPLLRRLLTKRDRDLLLLIKLERHEKRHGQDSEWSHTIAVVRIAKTLDLEYFEGRTNHAYRPGR